MMTRTRSARMLGLALFLLANALAVLAQERDPTVAPADTETGAAAQLPKGVEGMSVLMRDERPYLVVGTRLYAPGDTVGNLRVERISETEIWLHDGSALIKVPRFAGITRQTVAAKPLCGAATPAQSADAAKALGGAQSAKARKKRAKAQNPAKTSPVSNVPNTPPAVAPCEDTQP